MNQGLDGHFFMIIGPSAAGKDTLTKRLLQDFPILKKTLSHTTREKKPDETNGKDYYFISKQEYQKMQTDDNILMHYHNKLNDEFYGTAKQEILLRLQRGQYIIDETDEASVVDMIDNKRLERSSFSTIYIMAPSLIEANKRMQQQNQTEEEIIKNLRGIRDRIQYYTQIRDYFDLEIINKDIDESYAKLKTYVDKFIS